jgi:hypothetical protein
MVHENPGRIAQRESVPFTRERSKVRSLVRPPEPQLCFWPYWAASSNHLACPRKLYQDVVGGTDMAGLDWQTKRVSVASLHLDMKNPRLGRETLAQAPREIIQYLFEHDKAIEVAKSIANRGFFPNEPLLAVNENNRLVVVEGNRRLAALKALKEPGLLEGPKQRQVEKLSRKIIDPQSLATVPVTIAPNRKATDRQIAGRHIGTPVAYSLSASAARISNTFFHTPLPAQRENCV